MITIEFHDDDLKIMPRLLHAIQAQIARPELRTTEWQAIIDYLEGRHLSNFDNESTPDGEQWAPLSPITISRKGHAVRLFEEGLLKDSMSNSSAEHAIREVNPSELVFGTNRPWAASHQDGTDRIPQREFAGFTEEDMDHIADMVEQAMLVLIERVLETV